MDKPEAISYKTGTDDYYRCWFRFEERCVAEEVILTSLILGAAYSPRLWVPEVREGLTGQAKKNYQKWPEWLSRNSRIILWQVPKYIEVLKEEIEECWIRSKHDRDQTFKVFEDRVRSVVSFLESIKEERSRAVMLPSVLRFEILRSSGYTMTQSIHVFYRTFLEEKNFEGLYSYQPDGIKGLDLIMAQHVFSFVKERYDIFRTDKVQLDFTSVRASDLDLAKAYDQSYRTVKSAFSEMTAAYTEMDAFEDYEFHELDWWMDRVHRERKVVAEKVKREQIQEAAEGRRDRADELKRIRRKIERLNDIERQDLFHTIVGKSQAILNVIAQTVKASGDDVTVLIAGETGVGKQLFAEAIHANSSRHENPFRAVNLSELPETMVADELFGHERWGFTDAKTDRKGAFELCDRGTLFLDEVGELSNESQVKLLRVLEERRVQRIGGTRTISVDVRVIAATNRNLERAVDAGGFRHDLFHRLYAFPIEIPPLRERKEDIPMLVEHFIADFCAAKGMPPKRVTNEAENKLLLHDWPGNVRELKNCIERAVLSAEGDAIDEADILFPTLGLRHEVQADEPSEKELIIKALGESSSVGEAIEKLGWSRSTFYEKRTRYNIRSPKSLLSRPFPG